MRAVQVTCPNCGARLSVTDAPAVTCEYCGTASRVQRRTTMFQRVPPPPPGGPVAVQTVWSMPQTRRIAAISGVVSIVLIGLLVVGVRECGRRARAVAPGRAVTTSPAPPQGGGVLVADVDGDGVLDAITRTRRVTPVDEIRLAAIDGRTGEPRWTSDVLGPYGDTYQGALALVGDRLVFGSPRGELRAFAVATGAPGWSTRLDERPTRFCAGVDDATFVVIGADDEPRVRQRATGEAAAAAVPAGWTCAPLPTESTVPPSVSDWELAREHGLSLRTILARPSERVLLGQRAKGTRAPVIVVLEPDGAVRWQLVIPPDPLAASAQAPEGGVVADREVCASYRADHDEMHVACFALADGRRLWELPVHSNGLLTLAGSGLLVIDAGRLTRFELATGARTWRYPR